MIKTYKKSLRPMLEKGTAVFVCAAFLATSVYLPQAEASVSPAQVAGYRSLADDLTAIALPKEIGKIQETYRGTSDKIVVLIQDAHSIPDAQRSIRSAIDYFQTQYGVFLVGLEGASDKLDPQIFRSFPDKELLRKTFDAYAKRGELTGGTAAALFNASPGTYHGIEDWPLYEEGVSYFLRAIGMEPEIKALLDPMVAALNRAKEASYSKELLEIDRLLTSFGENKTDLVQVLNQLSKYHPPPKGSELAILIEEIRMGQITDTPIEIEIKKIAEQVQSVLKSQAPSPEIRQELQELNGKLQEFRTSRTTPQAFALHLKGLVKKHKIKVKVSRKLASLVENQKRLKDIEGTRLFEDFKRYADSVTEKLIGDSAVEIQESMKQLNFQSKSLELIKRFAQLELSFEDWEKVQKMMLQLDQWTITQDNVVSRDEVSALLKKMEPHLAFYRVAEKRDQVFLKNIQSVMEKKYRASSLLVAGGFHTEGLTQIFKANGMSYVLVTPWIGAIPEEPLYREHMQGQVSWSGYFEVKDGKVNLYDAFVRATRDQLISRATGHEPRATQSGERGLDRVPVNVDRSSEDDPRLLKSWRDQIIRDLAAEGRITQASEYTRFIDETAQQQDRDKIKKLRDAWLANIDRFGEGLKKLQADGNLSESSILQLIKTITIPEPALVGALAGRSVPAGWLNLAPTGFLKSRAEGSTPAGFNVGVQSPEIRNQVGKAILTQKENDIFAIDNNATRAQLEAMGVQNITEDLVWDVVFAIQEKIDVATARAALEESGQEALLAQVLNVRAHNEIARQAALADQKSQAEADIAGLKAEEALIGQLDAKSAQELRNALGKASVVSRLNTQQGRFERVAERMRSAVLQNRALWLQKARLVANISNGFLADFTVVVDKSTRYARIDFDAETIHISLDLCEQLNDGELAMIYGHEFVHGQIALQELGDLKFGEPSDYGGVSGVRDAKDKILHRALSSHATTGQSSSEMDDENLSGIGYELTLKTAIEYVRMCEPTLIEDLEVLSQAEELYCDELAIFMLTIAGFDVTAASSTFEKMKQISSQTTTTSLSPYQSHPEVGMRVRAGKEAEAKYAAEAQLRAAATPEGPMPTASKETRSEVRGLDQELKATEGGTTIATHFAGYEGQAAGQALLRTEDTNRIVRGLKGAVISFEGESGVLYEVIEVLPTLEQGTVLTLKVENLKTGEIQAAKKYDLRAAIDRVKPAREDSNMPGFEYFHGQISKQYIWYQYTNKQYQYLTDLKAIDVTEGEKERLYLHPKNKDALSKLAEIAKNEAKNFNGPIEFKYIDDRQTLLDEVLGKAEVGGLVLNFASEKDAQDFYEMLQAKYPELNSLLIGDVMHPATKKVGPGAFVGKGHTQTRQLAADKSTPVTGTEVKTPAPVKLETSKPAPVSGVKTPEPSASGPVRSEVRGLDQELKAIVPATAEQSVSAMSLTNKTGEAATPKAASALMRPSLESLPGYPIAPNMLPANEANHYATAFTSDVAGEIIQAVSKQGKARSITHLMLDGAQVSVTITVDEHLVKEGLDAERIASLIEKGYAALSDDEKTRFKSAITARRYVFGSIGRKDNKWQSRRLFESISDPLAAQGVIGVNEYLFQQGMEDPLLITQLFAGLPGTGEVLRDKARFDGMYRALGGAGDALESVRQWNASAENKRYNINAQVAENFITAAHDEYQFISDDKGEMGHVYAELKEIVDRLLAAEGYDPRSFHFHLADMSECNAFVVQFSNHIVLNTGLLWAFTQAIAGERTNANKGKLQSFFKEHVAFVIAHEIAHLKQSRDRVNSGDTPEPETMETIRKSMKESPWNKLMEKFKDHAKAYGYERDADNYAINIMDRAGYSVRNAYLPFTFFSEVIESQKGNKMVSWAKDLRDVHPTLPSRIADIKKSLRPAYFLSYEAPFEAFSSGFLEELLAWKGDGKSYLLKRTRPRDYSAKTMSVQSAQDFAHVIDDSASWEEWEMASHAGAFSYLNARGREYYASKEHRAEAEEARAVMREIVHEMRDSEKKIMALIKQNWKQWGMSEREYEELQDKMSYFFTYFYCDGIEYEIKDLKDEQLFSGWFIHLFTKKSDVEISLKDFAYPVFGGPRVYTENQTAHFAMEQAMQEAKGRIRDIVAGERFKGLRRRIEGDRDIQSELTGIRDVIRKNFDRLSRDKKLQDVSSRSSRFHSRYSFQRSFFDTPHFRVEEAGEDDDIKSPLKGLAGVPEPHEIGKISDMLEDVLAAAWSFDFIEQDEAAIKSRKLLAGLNYLPDNELRELHRSSVGKMAGAIESTFLSRLEELEARHDRGEAVQLPSIDQLIELLDKVINYQAIASERFGPSYEMGQIGKKLQEAIVARLQKNASLVTQEKLGKLLTVLTRNPEWVSGNPNLRRFLWENLIYNAQNYAHFRKDIQLLIHEIGNHQVIMDKGFSTYGITFDEIFPNGLADSRLQSNRYFDGVHGSPEDAARVFLEAYDLLGLSERNSEAYLENLFVKTERAFGLESSESRLKLYENILESAEGQGKIYLNLDASVGLMRPLAYAITTRAEGIMRGAVSFCELMTAKNIPLEVSGAWTSENYTKAAGSLRRSGKQVFKGHTIDAQGYLIEFEDNITEEDFDGSVKDATLLEVFRRSRQSTADVQQILQHIDSYLSRMSGNLGLDPQFVASIPSLHPEVRRFMYLFAIGGMVSMKDFYRFIKTHSETWSNEDIEALSYFLNRIAQFQQKRNLVGGTHRLTGSDLSSLEAQTWQQYLVPLALFAVQKRFSFKVDDDSSFSEAIEKKEDASSTTNPYHVLIGELVGTDASIKANAMKAVHRAPQKSIDRFDFSGMPKERVREIFAFIAQNADKDFDYWISYAERYMPASAMRNMFLYCVLWEKSLKPRLNAKDGEEPDLFYSWEFVSGVLSKSDLMKDDNVRNATARIEKLLVEDTVIKNLNAEGLGELFKNMASGGEKEKAAMKRGFIGRNLYIARYLTLNLIKMGIARPFFFLCWLGFKVLALLKGMGIPVRRATRIFHGMIEFPIDIFYNHDDSVTALFKSASLFKDDPLKMALLSKVMWSLAYMIFYNRLRVLPPARFILSSYFSLVKLMEKTPRVPWQFNEYGNIHSQIDLMAAYPNKGHLMGRAQSVGASWEDRLKEVESFFPRSSPVRDELLLGLAGTMPSSEGFKNLPVRDKENVLQALRTISGKVFQPFFREKLAMQALDLAIMAEEERTGQKISFDREVALIFEYFPDYSFTRDDVLYEVMEHARNPEAYQRLYSQILQVQDNASKESVREKIFGEHKIKELIQNADPLDKEEIALWIMGIRAEKPFAVQEMEWLNRIDMGYFKDLFNEVASTRYKTVGSTAKKDMMEALFGGKSGLMQDEFLFKNFLNKVFETSCPKSITNRSKLKTVFMTVFEHIPDEKKLDVIGAMATKIKPGVKTDIADLTKTFFESMGIIGIKLAQIISHSDAGETMDETVRLALADLSSSADPYGKKYAFQMLGLAFGERFGEHFSEIGKRLGSASIKVVYKVTLQDGRTLVMKLKRPDIDKTIEPQLKTLSGILDALTAKGVNVPPGLGDQIGMYIREEVDFGIEVRNQGRLQKNLSGRGEVALGGKKVTFVAPRSYTKEDLPELFNSIPKALQGVVMLEEYFPGVEFKAEELKKELGLTDQGVKDLKLTVFQELMTQVFKDGFFHADPHKGNILVRKESDGNIKAALIDLGSMGEVKDKFKLAQWLMYMATHKGETPKIPQEYILEAMFFKKIWYLMETMEPLEVAKEIFEKLLPEYQFPKDVERQLKVIDLAAKGKWQQITAGDYKLGVLDKVKEIYYNWRFGKGMGEMAGKPTGENVFSSGNAALPAVNPGAVSGPQDQTRSEMRDLGQGLKAAALSAALLASGLSGSVAEQQRDEAGKAARVELVNVQQNLTQAIQPMSQKEYGEMVARVPLLSGFPEENLKAFSYQDYRKALENPTAEHAELLAQANKIVSTSPEIPAEVRTSFNFAKGAVVIVPSGVFPDDVPGTIDRVSRTVFVNDQYIQNGPEGVFAKAIRLVDVVAHERKHDQLGYDFMANGTYNFKKHVGVEILVYDAITLPLLEQFPQAFPEGQYGKVKGMVEGARKGDLGAMKKITGAPSEEQSQTKTITRQEVRSEARAQIREDLQILDSWQYDNDKGMLERLRSGKLADIAYLDFLFDEYFQSEDVDAQFEILRLLTISQQGLKRLQEDPRFKGQGLKAPDVLRAILSNYLKFIATNQMVALEDKLLFQDASAVTPELQNWGRAQFYSSANKKQFYKNSVPVTVATVTEDLKKAGFDIAEKEVADNLDKENFLVLENGLIISTVDIENNAFRGSREKDAEFARYLTRNVIGAYDYGTRGGELASDAHAWSKALKPATGPKALHEIDFNLVLERIATGSIVPAPDEVYLAKAFKHVQDQSKTFKGARKRTILLEKDDGSLKSTVDILQELQRYQKAERELKPKYLNLLTRYVTASEGERVGIISEISPVFLSLTTQAKLLPEYIMEYFGNDFDESTAARLKQRLEAEQLKTKEFRQELAGQPMVRPDIKPETGPRSEQRVADETALKSVAPRVADALKPGSKNRVLGEANTRAVYEVTVRGDGGALIEALKLVVEEEMAKAEITAKASATTVRVTKEMADAMVQRVLAALEASKIKGNLTIGFDVSPDKNFMEAMRALKDRIGTAVFPKDQSRKLDRKSLEGVIIQTVGSLKSYNPLAAENARAVPVLSQNLDSEYFANEALFGVGSDGNVQGEPFLDVAENVVRIAVGLLKADLMTKGLKSEEINDKLLEMLFNLKVGSSHGVLSMNGRHLVVHREALEQIMREYQASSEVSKAA